MSIEAGRRVSEFSVAWTIFASTIAIVLGAASGGIVLVAFGAVGYVDALGSIALVHHFRHGQKRAALEDRFERRAHRVVTIGLLSVGTATVVASVQRLVVHASPDPAAGSVLIAALSIVVLTILARRKRVIAREIPSPALAADGHLSAVGAMQAAVALVGVVAARAFGWNWADATAALAVGVVAIVLGMQSHRSMT